ncbi:hypothetical protein L226DRAFT_151497 [Lentinus tigrinus ALCF2SS1-7]|uniref:uncharacterized protein n=1 Tax=Lentinus tigrinus ALCF2SS1-7 TaxID=1328758 RepID=UPI0011660E2C|nr:hypothetical protein L226DRAFT_151497 [Lentinus tigrinus ALCF2SS1-7]
MSDATIPGPLPAAHEARCRSHRYTCRASTAAERRTYRNPVRAEQILVDGSTWKTDSRPARQRERPPSPDGEGENSPRVILRHRENHQPLGTRASVNRVPLDLDSPVYIGRASGPRRCCDVKSLVQDPRWPIQMTSRLARSRIASSDWPSLLASFTGRWRIPPSRLSMIRYTAGFCECTSVLLTSCDPCVVHRPFIPT